MLDLMMPQCDWRCTEWRRYSFAVRVLITLYTFLCRYRSIRHVVVRVYHFWCVVALCICPMCASGAFRDCGCRLSCRPAGLVED